MNRLALPGTVWIAADIHLSAQASRTRRAFHEFLARARLQADTLILCGDLFDAWIGDDLAISDPPVWLAETVQQLRKVAQDIPLWIARGNRDFLMGQPLMRHLGARMLPQPCCLDTVCGAVLLSHGDEYCMGDLHYQRLRKIVREPLVQGLFLSLNLRLRSRIAEWARSRSKASTRGKPAGIMDVTPLAIEKAFRRSKAHIMVHGHTHRPAVHRLQVDGQDCTRIVLPDWDYENESIPRGGWLVIDPDGSRITSLADPETPASA